MGTKRKSSSDEELLVAALQRARDVLQTRAVATATQLGAPRIRERVIETLVSEGYERTGKKVRVSARRQLDGLLAGGAYLPVADLHKRLSGVTKREAQALVSELSANGKASLILRGAQLSVASESAAIVERDALGDLTAELKQLLDWVKKAQKNKAGATVLKSDLAESINTLAGYAQSKTQSNERSRASGPERAQAENREGNDVALAMRGAILALRDEDSGLASVPDVSRRLAEQATSDRIKKELLAAHSRGQVELRPEGGIGRLSKHDASLCPLGAGGVALSFVRLLEN